MDLGWILSKIHVVLIGGLGGGPGESGGGGGVVYPGLTAVRSRS